MNLEFRKWLADGLETLRLLEVSALFNRAAYNGLFEREVLRLIHEHPDMLKRLQPAMSLDWVGYIAKSLRPAGFQDHDIDPLTHEVVIKLLVSPGGLFRNWDGQPIDARFKVAVRNAVLNLVEKRRSKRRYGVTSLDDPQAGQVAGRDASVDEEPLYEFRTLVSERLGAIGLAVLDLRLRDQDVKSLVGSLALGKPSSYRIKLLVQAIKQLAVEFAHRRGDSGLLRQVQKAMADEQKVVQKRVAGNKARMKSQSLR